MCGIVVGLAFGQLNKRDEAIRQRMLRYFTTELLVRTEERGKDATGAAVLFERGAYSGIKRGEKSSDFLGTFGESKDYYGGFLRLWREAERNALVYLGHCRQGTTGDKEDNENNHPIKIGNLVGIHNGVIRNHDVIFEKLDCKRDGKVDSEAIFRLFDHYTNKGKEPFTMDMIQEVVKRLSGQFAITMFNADNPFQVPVFRDGRPVELVLIKRYGILLMVSEEKFWSEIHFRYERLVHYFREFFRVNLPSLLSKDGIEKKSLQDDSAAIFDLTKSVTQETKIEDLCEWKKMDRTKIWTTSSTTTTTTSNTSYVGNHTTNDYWKNRSASSTSKKSSADDGKKRRVFDKITKTFVVKQGDKILGDDKSITLSVDDDDKSETKALVPVEVTSTVDNKRSDVSAQTRSTCSADLEDRSEYSDPEESNNVTVTGSEDDVIDVDPSKVEILEAGGDVVEIEMKKFPPTVVEAANKAYESLENKGYGNWEELLDDLSIESSEKAETLGHVIVANRAWKASWKNGFMHGALWSRENSEDSIDKDKKDKKEAKREKHIVGLKTFVLAMAGFFNKNENDTLKERLREAALNLDEKVDVEEITKLFNSHERKDIKKVGEIIAEAEQYK